MTKGKAKIYASLAMARTSSLETGKPDWANALGAKLIDAMSAIAVFFIKLFLFGR